jgi:hypothetical protein
MNPNVTRAVKLGLWLFAALLGALVLQGSSAATNLFHAPPPRPSPPGKDELAIGNFQCAEQNGTGFPFLQIRGTSAISSPFLGGQFPLSVSTGTPLTCQSLAQQVAADAAAGGCTVGPVSQVTSGFDPAETTVHFVCSGDHDAVIAALGQVSSSLAAVTIAGAIE